MELLGGIVMNFYSFTCMYRSYTVSLVIISTSHQKRNKYVGRSPTEPPSLRRAMFSFGVSWLSALCIFQPSRISEEISTLFTLLLSSPSEWLFSFLTFNFNYLYLNFVFTVLPNTTKNIGTL